MTVNLGFGSSGAAVDVTAYVKSVSFQRGFTGPFDHIAAVGTCQIVLRNEDGRFTPGNSGGPYYGNLLPMRTISITSGANVAFAGYVASIVVNGTDWTQSEVTINGIDRIGVFQTLDFSGTLLTSARTDYLAYYLVGYATTIGRASLIADWYENPSDGDTVSVAKYSTADSGIESVTYTFKNTPAAAGDVLIGADLDTTLDYLVDAINGTYNANVYAGTPGVAYVDASLSSTGDEISATAASTGSPLGTSSGGLTYWIAQSFVAPQDGSIGRIGFKLIAPTGSPTGGITIMLYDDDSNKPGTAISGVNLPVNSPSVGWNYRVGYAGTIDFATTVSGTKYWLVLKATVDQTAGNFYRWSAEQNVYADGQRAYSTDNGSTWTVDAYDHSFSIKWVSQTTITATQYGDWGNYITFTWPDVYQFPPNTQLSGGDAPITAEPAIQIVDYAGDQWSSDRVNLLTALQDVMDSEQGWLFIDADNEVQFKNQQWKARLMALAADLTVNNTQAGIDGGMDLSEVWNRAVVTYTPRRTLTSGVVAQSNSAIKVPGNSGGARHRVSDPITQGMTVVNLPFVDPSTGRRMGAKNLIPPVPGTDFTVNDRSDGTGSDYTTSGRITITMASTGSEVQLSFINTATGPLFVRGLQIRGVGIVDYDVQQATFEDSRSQTAYGRHDLGVTLPLPVTNAQVYAESLAGYLLGKFKTPAYRLTSVTFIDTETVGSTALLSLDIGSTITLTDSLTGVSSKRYVVLGISGQIDGATVRQVSYLIEQLDEQTYWLLDSTTYSVLDSTTRLYI